jgi:hypothetical protein
MFLDFVSAEQCCGDENKLDSRNDVCDCHRGVKPNKFDGYVYLVVELNSKRSRRECGISTAQRCLSGSGVRLRRGSLDYARGFVGNQR